MKPFVCCSPFHMQKAHERVLESFANLDEAWTSQQGAVA
jgi:hypothetical protein